MARGGRRHDSGHVNASLRAAAVSLVVLRTLATLRGGESGGLSDRQRGDAVTRLLVLRLIVWVLPVAFAFAVARRHRTGSVVAAVILGVVWNAWSLLAMNAIAVELGWWEF